MAMKPTTMAENAMKYAKNGWAVYPLIQGGRIPHKGSSGHLDATSDPEEVKKLFLRYGVSSNIGISLLNTEYIILDIDLHDESKNGFDSLKELEDTYQPLPDTFTVTTPRNGLHMYYRIPGLSYNDDWVDFLPGVDLLGSKVMATPSVTENGMYRVKSGKISEVAELPKWFIETMVQYDRQKKAKNDFRMDYSQPSKGKKYTASFMEELLAGQSSGNRNSWTVKQFGRMIALGMDFTAAYEWIKIINKNFIEPPLSAKELNAIVMSIAKREQRKYEKVGGE